MIDIHCHILPELDDGADSMSTTVEMSIMGVEHGTTRTVCTPHCSTDDPDLPNRFQIIREVLGNARSELARRRIPMKLYPGMELFCSEGLEQVLKMPGLLTLADSRYLLIEFDFDVRLFDIYNAAGMILDSGLVPIIAHPERYTVIQETPDAALRLFRGGAMLQLNKGSILGRFGRDPYYTAEDILANGLAHCIASDAHRDTFRTPPMDNVYDIISRRNSEHYADILLNRNPRRIIENRDPVGTEE